MTFNFSFIKYLNLNCRVKKSQLHVVKMIIISLSPLKCKFLYIYQFTFSPWGQEFDINIIEHNCSNLDKTVIMVM